MRKGIAFLIVLSIAESSLIMIESAHAQTIPVPSVPQFTAKFIDASYNETSTDPYSGQLVTQFVLNRTIDVTIENQPLATYNSSRTSFYYNIRMKGHFETTWTNVSTPSKGLLLPSSSKTTVYSYTEGEFYNAPPAFEIGNFFFQPNPNNTAEIDIQVEALIGSLQPAVNPQGIPSRWTDNFIGLESGWSNTQTISIPQLSPSETPTLTPTETPTLTIAPTPSPVIIPSPTQTANQVAVPIWLYAVTLGMAVVIGVLIGIVVMQRRKIKK